MPDTSPTSLSLQHTSRVEMYPLLIRLFPSSSLVTTREFDRVAIGRKRNGEGRKRVVLVEKRATAAYWKSHLFRPRSRVVTALLRSLLPPFPPFYSQVHVHFLSVGGEERRREDTGIVARNRNIREIYVWKYNIWKRRSFDGWRAIKKIRNIYIWYFC